MLTLRKYFLKKFKAKKYIDCPVPKVYWDIMQEYAEAYHKHQKELDTCDKCWFRNVSKKCYPCHQCENNFVSMFKAKK